MYSRKQFFLVFCIILYAFSNKSSTAVSNKSFPDGFKFGVATASYQVEGAWADDGKGENIWDHLCHFTPDQIDNQDNGDVACDSYHKYKDDVAMIKNLGVDFYRFSLSWSRILPTGATDNINQAGVDYYNNILSELKANGIEPLVTMYHWDLPQPLQDFGGWTDPSIVEYFANYSRLVYDLYGDSVKTWLTFNEPKQTCQQGYGYGTMAPSIQSPGQLEYVCTHNLLKAHAKAYHIYDDEFRASQGGKVSITIDSTWYEPSSDDDLDKEAAERTLQFIYGWFANPVYKGNYPQVMIDRIADRSMKEGYEVSRLPEFTQEEIDYINGTFDYMGLNHYTTSYAKWKNDAPIGEVSFDNDLSVDLYQDPSWEESASDWLKVVPWGMRNLLRWMKLTYNNPEIIITENGFSDRGTLDDDRRINFYKEYLSNVLEAIYEDGVQVKGYTAWSLMDNFEWERGYAEKFGLYHVDFEDSNRTRTPKASVDVYKRIVASKCLLDDGNCEK